MKIIFSPPSDEALADLDKIVPKEDSSYKGEYPLPSDEDHNDIDNLIMAITLLMKGLDLNDEDEEHQDIVKEKPARFKTINEYLRDTIKH